MSCIADQRKFIFPYPWKIEARLHEKYPDKWIPAYSQVTFSPHIRYSDALARGNMQEEIMKEVMTIEKIEDNWDNAELHQQIIQKIPQ